MQKTISELNLESQTISEKWNAELMVIHKIFKKKLTDAYCDTDTEERDSDDFSEDQEQNFKEDDILNDKNILAWLNQDQHLNNYQMNEFQSVIGSASHQDLQRLNRIDSSSSIQNTKIISCQNFMLSSYSKKMHKKRYLIYSQRQSNLLKKFKAKTIIMHHSLCQIYTYADELLKLEMDPAHFGSIYNRPRAWMRMCDDFNWDGLRQFILKAIFEEYQALTQDKSNTQMQYKAYTVLRVMFVAFKMPLEQLIVYVIEACFDVKKLSSDQTQVYQLLQMINKEMIQKYSKQFVKNVINRINNIEIAHTSQELAAINFLALAKINKHLCLDLNTLGYSENIPVDRLLLNTENQMFKLMRWTKLPSESKIWVSGKKALVYDHVGEGKGLQIPNNLEVYCQLGKTQSVRLLPVILHAPENLISLSLSQCPCPDLSKCKNIRNMAIFWVHNIDIYHLESMNKMEVCYFGDIRIKNQKKEIPIGDTLTELIQRWKQLRLCRIWFCPMSSQIVLHGPCPNLEILDIADCDGLNRIIIDSTTEMDEVFGRLEALQVDSSEFNTLEVVGSVKMPALVCLQGFSAETISELRKGIHPEEAVEEEKPSKEFKIIYKPHKDQQEAKISEIKIGLNRSTCNNVGKLFVTKM